MDHEVGGGASKNLSDGSRSGRATGIRVDGATRMSPSHLVYFAELLLLYSGSATKKEKSYSINSVFLHHLVALPHLIVILSDGSRSGRATCITKTFRWITKLEGNLHLCGWCCLDVAHPLGVVCRTIVVMQWECD